VADERRGYPSEMAPEDPGRLADELEQQADRLARHGQEVQGRIDDTRQEWEQKRADPSVPGTNPPPQPATDEPADDATGQGGPGGVGEPGSTGSDAA
jgi:hypothetical protein